MSNAGRPKSHVKLITMLLLMLITVSVMFYYSVTHRAHAQSVREIKIDGLYLTPSKKFNNFQLTDNKGNALTHENLKGKWTMMFFGFTNCGMVCPTTLSSLNKMYQLLEKDVPSDQLPQVLFISVDPERDTVAKLNSYVKTFNSHFIGATGTPEAIAALTKQLHILAIKVNTKNSYYYDHSAEVLLINPKGDVQAYLSYPHKPEQLVKDYKLVLTSTKS